MNRTVADHPIAATVQPSVHRGRSLLLSLAAVGAAFSVMAVGAALWSTEVEAAIVANPPAAMEQAPLRLRCETCGVVEAITRIESATGASYDFAVRLPDGSLRHSTDALRGNWQVGDRMQLLGGGRNWSALAS